MKFLMMTAIALSFLTTGCSKTVADFVNQARTDDPVLPKINLKDDAAPKVSPARIQAVGTATRMEGNFTVTNRVLKSSNLRATITVSRSSNAVQ